MQVRSRVKGYQHLKVCSRSLCTLEKEKQKANSQKPFSFSFSNVLGKI
jgi:hypothetical protein